MPSPRLAPWARIITILASVSAIAVLLLGMGEAGDRTGMFFGLWRMRHILLAGVLVHVALIAGLACLSRQALFGGVFLMMLTGGTVFLLEIAGALGIVDYGERFGNRSSLLSNSLGAARNPNVDVRGETYQDIASGWGIEHAPIPFHYRTDANGYRNEIDPAQARVYLLGDSIVVGALVDFDATVAGRLSRDPRTAALNVALIGISVQEEIALFDELALPLDGRHVVQFFFEGNDLLDSRTWRSRRAGQGPEPESWIETAREKSFTYNLLYAAQRASAPGPSASDRVQCAIGGQDYLFAWMSQSFENVETEIDPVLEALEAFAARVRSAGATYRVVFVPSKFRVLGSSCEPGALAQIDPEQQVGPMREVLERWSGRTRIPVIDLTQALVRATEEGRVPWFWGDTHWNASGNAIAADAIAASLGVLGPGEPGASGEAPGR